MVACDCASMCVLWCSCSCVVASSFTLSYPVYEPLSHVDLPLISSLVSRLPSAVCCFRYEAFLPLLMVEPAQYLEAVYYLSHEEQAASGKKSGGGASAEAGAGDGDDKGRYDL